MMLAPVRLPRSVEMYAYAITAAAPTGLVIVATRIVILGRVEYADKIAAGAISVAGTVLLLVARRVFKTYAAGVAAQERERIRLELDPALAPIRAELLALAADLRRTMNTAATADARAIRALAELEHPPTAEREHPPT